VKPGELTVLIAAPLGALILDVIRPKVARIGDQGHLVGGLTSGLLLGTAFFVLLGQALRCRPSSSTSAEILSLAGIGFIGTVIFDRCWYFYRRRRDTFNTEIPSVLIRGTAGVTVGASLHTSPTTGLLVATTLLLREIAYPANALRTVHGMPGLATSAPRLASIMAFAACLTLVASSSISAGNLSIILALTAGSCVYMGASILVPETHHAHPQAPTLAMTALGSLLIYLIVA
jgi:uncharacterized membrane protein